MCKVLIIDDDQDFAEATADLLQTEEQETVIAFDSEQAMAALDETIDVVLSDIKLGKTNGTHLLSQIKNRYDIPVIMITAYASTDTAIESLKRQASDYLIKPCDPIDIIDAVAKAARESFQKKQSRKRTADLVESLKALKEI